MHFRTTVYTIGGTQIGLRGVGQSKEAFTFPTQYLTGEALKSPHWARFSAAKEFAAEPIRLFRALDAAERLKFLIYDNGDPAYPAFDCQCFGLRGKTLQAVVAQNFVPLPVIPKPCHSLEGIRTPPTPSSELGKELEQEAEFEQYPPDDQVADHSDGATNCESEVRA